MEGGVNCQPFREQISALLLTGGGEEEFESQLPGSDPSGIEKGVQEVEELKWREREENKENLMAKALYDNVPESPEELAFRKGDILTVIEQNTGGLEGWWLCSLHGRQGIAPGNRLKLLIGPMFEAQPPATQAPPSGPAETRNQQKPGGSQGSPQLPSSHQCPQQGVYQVPPSKDLYQVPQRSHWVADGTASKDEALETLSAGPYDQEALCQAVSSTQVELTPSPPPIPLSQQGLWPPAAHVWQPAPVLSPPPGPSSPLMQPPRSPSPVAFQVSQGHLAIQGHPASHLLDKKENKEEEED
ncbi:hypothetical protein JZ751_024038 [Albula glossodonta]|uniref:SH3 domain-containing protein n=1 Tax=Albula glossodonta TaxID=121402 RepID=A0A8T2NIT4_9TELE|nr:hypothetical protein JZ751_024038 [Albula glossodonta]